MNVKLVAKGAVKLFNDRSGEALARLNRGESKEDIFRATGATVAVNDVSFEVHEGEIFVIMGLSGSGKSTLVRMLNGLVPPTAGEIWIDGAEIASCGEARLRDVRRREITMVFQHFALFPHMTVAENVAFGLKVKGVGRAARREAAIKALAQVGLEDYADSLPSELSGGMQQRVGLARGLATDPEILLMDEPFGALDPLIRREMQDELRVLQRKLGKAIVFITHDLNEALLLGDRIAIMKDGVFVQVGTAQEIVSNPADDYVRAFVADIDRSRVFTAADVAQEAASVPPGASVDEALRAMDAAGSEAAHVVDDGCVVGVVTRRDLTEGEPVTRVDLAMQSDAPVVEGSSFLNEMYGPASTGLPIAVTDPQGRLIGAVPPAAILSQLAGEDQPPEPEASAPVTDESAASAA
ncbi:glycine betaine/L-proline ABC transporter ATP-binding protein [Phaeovulum sp. NW3]|uniref:quaternary amine ABC transporter ATP-binding protein n=1 Tax=Phaeovulum sp. NW3 TaxID=2934933 RepID=UPI0020213E85|nr:glycine betaine/L-proline ABC transporter ATP-binding protein [Phaeovulum sp. NW3]MCL7466615.1 glycine betaine/L-proline ABC transporter ATP-binding protein [Phaeovulum sp. NW3]